MRNKDINITSFVPMRPGKTHILHYENPAPLRLAVEGECPGCKSRGPERLALPVETSSSPSLLLPMATVASMASFLPFIFAILHCGSDTNSPDFTGLGHSLQQNCHASHSHSSGIFRPPTLLNNWLQIWEFKVQFTRWPIL